MTLNLSHSRGILIEISDMIAFLICKCTTNALKVKEFKKMFGEWVTFYL